MTNYIFVGWQFPPTWEPHLRKLRIGVIDLVTKGPTKSLYGWVMHANLASIMPQIIATWCEQDGHDVTFMCYTGRESFTDEMPENLDLVFVGAFTQTAQLSYAISAMCRARGAVTVLGGPHARCYPEDSANYFDYVVGFANREIIRDILSDCEEHRPLGRQLAAPTQPESLPGRSNRYNWRNNPSNSKISSSETLSQA